MVRAQGGCWLAWSSNRARADLSGAAAAQLPQWSGYFFLQKRFSMSTEPLVTVAVAVVGPDFEPK